MLEARIPANRRSTAAKLAIYRQYVGMHQFGRKVIYVNGFTGPEPDRLWRSQVLVVCDGGPTSFGAVFDVDGGAFTEFHGNGPL